MAAVLLVAVAPAVAHAKAGVRVLIMGGGTSHDFARNYQQIDAKTLREAGDSVRYVDTWEDLASGLATADVLIQASNQTPPGGAVREKIMQFVRAGGGLIVAHAGVWYNWAAWPDYNQSLVGGGTRSHDKLGDFEVTVTHSEHPIMAGVPARFTVHDELYHQEIDPAGAPVEVLATAASTITGKTYASVWVVNGGHGRIVCIAPGHDDATHNEGAYRQLLVNAVEWAGGKPSAAQK